MSVSKNGSPRPVHSSKRCSSVCADVETFLFLSFLLASLHDTWSTTSAWLVAEANANCLLFQMSESDKLQTFNNHPYWAISVKHATVPHVSWQGSTEEAAFYLAVSSLGRPLVVECTSSLQSGFLVVKM